jgi:hypothetical protein
MPSSLIFSGLVVLWLLILVPAFARQQQEVARIDGASLGGRVLARSGRRIGGRIEEVDSVDDDDTGAVATRPAGSSVRMAAARVATELEEPARSRWSDADDHAEDAAENAAVEGSADSSAEDRSWDRPPPRYRPGRGGYNPEADAVSARNRYAFRQRVVLALLVCALLTAVAAAAVLRVLWWAHAAVDLVLVTYLIHLRRQVRLEQAIRERRAARMAGTRRTSAADDRDVDDWAHRGREVARRPNGSTKRDDGDVDRVPEPADSDEPSADAKAADPVDSDVDEAHGEWDEDDDAERVRGVGEPVGLLPARRRGADGGHPEPESALPRLDPAPPPPLPPGTSLVVVDDDELDLHDLGSGERRSHRRAAGQ